MSSFISKKRATRILQRMRGRRVSVVGDWMLDRYVWGTANRISPEAAVPVVDFVKQSETLGGAGNVAANLAALGARVTAFGVAGRDEAGGALLRCLREMRLPEKGIVEVRDRPTTLKTRIIARQQQVVRVDREARTHLSEQVEAHLVKSILAALKSLDALIISDYDKGVISDLLAERILDSCARRRIPSFVKPKWSRLPAYRGASVVICNRKEAEFLVTRPLDTPESVADAGRALLDHFGCSAVVITRGPEGLSLFEREALEKDPRGFHVAALNQETPMGLMERAPHGDTKSGRQVFDVTGAGDTVLATMALASASGASLREAAVLGNAAAGVVVAKLGTATLTRDELATVLRESGSTSRAAGN
ncbi:MAG TPA: PfkB family carbohydrate kinase [Candidatus Acidoferrales bacterium]|nr:PfkB family carbohydrate kinase [Candidatus Acidoferrales bacterium]